MVKEWLSSSGRSERDLVALPKGDPGKAELARMLRRHTPMTRQWIARRLHMGRASYVSYLVSDR